LTAIRLRASFCGGSGRALSPVLDGMLADPTFMTRIGTEQIGAAGFSLGGYTMIAIAGCFPSLAHFRFRRSARKAEALGDADEAFRQKASNGSTSPLRSSPVPQTRAARIPGGDDPACRADDFSRRCRHHTFMPSCTAANAPLPRGCAWTRGVFGAPFVIVPPLPLEGEVAHCDHRVDDHWEQPGYLFRLMTPAQQ
jgi:hypothetical protein